MATDESFQGDFADQSSSFAGAGYEPVFSGEGDGVVPDVDGMRIQIVNVAFIGTPGAPAGEWVLVDAGMPHSAARIEEGAAERFGPNRPPAVILLTHGHFDHVGALLELCETWGVPIYAHPLELPYLTGERDYPPADPGVGGGMMAWVSPLYPREALDLRPFVQPLPDDGSVPGLPNWEWVHTPGHTPGHVSFFRRSDRVLVAGDVFTTVKQESMWAVLTQAKTVHGPPAYFTTDWDSAWKSVKRVRDLHPTWALTGHGLPLWGKELTDGLDHLAEDFPEIAIPNHGRYLQ